MDTSATTSAALPAPEQAQRAAEAIAELADEAEAVSYRRDRLLSSLVFIAGAVQSTVKVATPEASCSLGIVCVACELSSCAPGPGLLNVPSEAIRLNPAATLFVAEAGTETETVKLTVCPGKTEVSTGVNVTVGVVPPE